MNHDNCVVAPNVVKKWLLKQEPEMLAPKIGVIYPLGHTITEADGDQLAAGLGVRGKREDNSSTEAKHPVNVNRVLATPRRRPSALRGSTFGYRKSRSCSPHKHRSTEAQYVSELH